MAKGVKQNYGKRVPEGCCAACSKPVGKINACLWREPNVWVHHVCLPRIVAAMPKSMRSA